jgi:hypothetical protein
MPEEPIEIVPGVYRKSGGREVLGLCIMIDDQDDQWEVATSDHYATIIKINKGAKWKVQEFTDPKTGNRKVQLFREGAKLRHLAQQFIPPTEGAYAQNAGASKNEGPELKIHYTTPEDSQTPPRKKP